MTFPRLGALNRYWAEHPPIHLLAAAYVGYKPKKKKEASRENMDELMQLMGGSLVRK